MSYIPNRRPGARILAKVPKITLLFWILKIVSTGMGEAISDALVYRFNPVLAVLAVFVIFLFALKLQFSKKKYIPGTYWFAVSMVAVFGTMAADAVHIVLGIPYIISSAAYALALVIVFIGWYKTEGTLSIHSIYTRRREAFYWLAVLSTFAMGTALGDLFAFGFKLGFLTSGLIFLALFLVPTLIYLIFKWNEVFTFWFAYIITRPLGASFADWFGKPRSVNGLGYGDAPVAIVLVIILIILVIVAAKTHEEDPWKHPLES
ncbi:MAG TPA: hypothetical protein VFN51_01830 [Candidatus Saccharimonadales bacterium]|nr:hypothetical protein [Candidatus Saccharimonadales bacterium]